MMIRNIALVWTVLYFCSIPAFSGSHKFRKVQLTDKYYSEGANFGDLNRDGVMDVVYGPFWYAGPEFKQRHQYYPGKEFPADGKYADNFFVWVDDFDRDGWNDILVQVFPGKGAFWYENPRGKDGDWNKHLAYPVVGNESPTFGDLTGDARNELIFTHGPVLGYAEPDWSNPTEPWTFRAISPEGRFRNFTHGLGFGDVDGDGTNDFLERDGWWENSPSLSPGKEMKHHPTAFAPEGQRGGAQMYAYDVDGDGLNDVITSWDGHGFGLAWYQQQRQADTISFSEHVIMNKEPGDNKSGVKFSQLHAVNLADMNGDGLKDIVTGKCFWAHGPTKDPEPNAPAVLYWFELKRSPDGAAEFVPHLVDDDSGVGRQVSVGDISGNGHTDIVVGNKKGSFVFLQEGGER